MIVTFFGHHDTIDTAELRLWLIDVVTALIMQGADQFLLGGYGSFDRIAADVVWKMHKDYPYIQSVLIVPYLQLPMDTAHFDRTLYPSLENIPYRYAILKRNEWMVHQADVVITNISHSWGGAAKAAEYAKKTKKRVINYKYDKK